MSHYYISSLSMRGSHCPRYVSRKRSLASSHHCLFVHSSRLLSQDILLQDKLNARKLSHPRVQPVLMVLLLLVHLGNLQ
jgi:hypothetical protein